MQRNVLINVAFSCPVVHKGEEKVVRIDAAEREDVLM
jgi:hypothetical protein